MNDDPFLIELREKSLRNSASVRIAMVLNGQVVTGIPTGNPSFVERVNSMIEELAAQLPEDDPLRAGAIGLRFDAADEESVIGRFISLREANLRIGVVDLELGLIRVDLRAVTAWGIVPPIENTPNVPAS